jgi:exodeoxyribonuclease VII large subunit
VPIPILSVSQFTSLLNETLAGTYQHIIIEGEVSGFKVNSGKYVFFDLKDAEATIGCFMMIYQLKVPLEDGMKIKITATPKLTSWGRFSLNVSAVELSGEGSLQRAYELLKSKLETEGLFEIARKRSLPKYPLRIGLVTSHESAAYADFNKIINQRWNGLEISLANVQVQGASAPEQIVGAIEYFNQQPELSDVLVIIRGGGSLEDLQAFNTELVARSISASRIPTVVGVGHEVDTTLADLVADFRAATPTDAAKSIAPDKEEVLRTLVHFTSLMERNIRQTTGNFAQVLDHNLSKLEKFFDISATNLETVESRLKLAMRQVVNNKKDSLVSIERVLRSLDPKEVLRRGYTIVRHNGRILRSSNDVVVGDTLMLQLLKSKIKAEVKGIDNGE